MENNNAKDDTGTSEKLELVRQVFDDPEAKSNLVSLFDVLLHIDMRINPQDYKAKQTQ